MKSLDDMNFIYYKYVNNITEFNLLHDILNYSKNNKNINSHYSSILYGCINTPRSKNKLKNFRIFLDS